MSLATPTPIDQPASFVRVNAPLSGIPSSLALERMPFSFLEAPAGPVPGGCWSPLWRGGARAMTPPLPSTSTATPPSGSIPSCSVSAKRSTGMTNSSEYRSVSPIAGMAIATIRAASLEGANWLDTVGRPVSAASRAASVSSSCTGAAAEDRRVAAISRPALSTSLIQLPVKRAATLDAFDGKEAEFAAAMTSGRSRLCRSRSISPTCSSTASASIRELPNISALVVSSSWRQRW